ncbi:hypothetical protein NEFER03_2200 [Nematocida sp. LUAm3]|nr:hypothetical protein NEFER03_2200 [Nematocida sp. LUAm3]KAI5176420.1 hypothetical protein NEFER02_2183 [Nematocida sp. LUAm2]KAI5179297.1 hypothetical protein NEFER01_2146 [Nematocida sp. LUAm1]
MRNISVLDISCCTLIPLLLFCAAHSTECTELAQVQREEQENNQLAPSHDRSIICNLTEEEEKSKIVVDLKKMLKDQKIAEKNVLYLVLHWKLSCIELVEEKNNKYHYSVEIQDIFRILNDSTNSKKLIWLILVDSLPDLGEKILNINQMPELLQAICTQRNVVFEYMGQEQYDKLLEESQPKLTRYTIRLRKLAALSKYFKLYEEGRWNLVLYNALSMHPQPTSLISYITNMFVCSWSKFNKAHIIIDTLNGNHIAMAENEKKIIKSIGKYAKPAYATILNHLAGLANTPIYICDSDGTSPNTSQITTSCSTPFNLPPISFVFFKPNSNSEETFPLQTILSIASLQNCGVLIETLYGVISTCSVMLNYAPGRVELPFCLWRQFKTNRLNSFLSRPGYCYLIRDVDYRYFYYMMRNIPFHSSFASSTLLLPLPNFYTSTPPLYNNCSIVNEKLENIFPNTNISGVVYHAQQHIVIMQSISKEKIVTKYEYRIVNLVDVVISKDEVFLKYSLVEKNTSIGEKRKLDSTTQDENNSPPEKRIELNSHNNATNSTNTIIVDATADNKETGHLKSCLDNSRTIPPHPNPCSDPDFESNITLDPDFELDSKVNPTRYLGSYSDLDFDFDFLS